MSVWGVPGREALLKATIPTSRAVCHLWRKVMGWGGENKQSLSLWLDQKMFPHPHKTRTWEQGSQATGRVGSRTL